MRTNRQTAWAVGAAAILVLFSPLRAEDEAFSRFQFFAGWAIGPSGAATTLDNHYDPNPGYPIPGSYARQALQISPAAGRGFEAGLTYAFNRTLGLRISLDSTAASLTGENAPFDFLYKYSNYFPFIDRPTETFVSFTQDWPATAGVFRRATGSLEIVLRWPVRPFLDLAVSTGPALNVMGGEVFPLGYVEYRGSSHGGLFFRFDFLNLRLPLRTTAGWTAGIEAVLRVVDRLSIRVGAAWRTGGTYDSVPQVEMGYDSYQLQELPAATLDLIRSTLVLPSLTLKPAPFRFGLDAVFGF